jgi:hypothetical protein
MTPFFSELSEKTCALNGCLQKHGTHLYYFISMLLSCNIKVIYLMSRAPTPTCWLPMALSLSSPGPGVSDRCRPNTRLTHWKRAKYCMLIPTQSMLYDLQRPVMVLYSGLVILVMGASGRVNGPPLAQTSLDQFLCCTLFCAERHFLAN